MRVVPENRVLIQPTIQYRWLLQHGTIEFVIANELIAQFLEVWSRYRALGLPEPDHFFSDPSLEAFDLVNNDKLFALLAGAIYAQQQTGAFNVWLSSGVLVWSIAQNPNTASVSGN